MKIFKTLKEIEDKQSRLKGIRPMTREEYGLKKQKELLKDVLRLIESMESLDLGGRNNCVVISKELLKSKIIGEDYNQSQEISVKKDASSLSDEHLGTQSITEEDKLRENMSVDVDNQHSLDINLNQKERDFNKQCRKLRKESWNDLMKKSSGNYDKAMEILNDMDTEGICSKCNKHKIRCFAEAMKYNPEDCCECQDDIICEPKEINAKVEQMLLHQVLEEHIEKDKKHYQPCQDCIRLGINKGYNYYLNQNKGEQND